MTLVVERTQELTGADGAALLLLDDGYLSVRAATGSAASQLRVRLPLAATALGEWVDDGEPVLCADTSERSASQRELDRTVLERTSARSMVTVPLRHDQRTVGLLQVVSSRPSAFAERDVDSLQLLGVVLSAAMSQAAEFSAKREQVDALAQFEAMYHGAPIGILFVAPMGRSSSAILPSPRSSGSTPTSSSASRRSSSSPAPTAPWSRSASRR